MDNLDLDILTFMGVRNNNEQYKGMITKSLCTKESWTLLGDMTRYFEQFPNEKQITSDFKLWFRSVAHPNWSSGDHTVYSSIIDNILATEVPDREAFVGLFNHLKLVTKFKQELIKVEDGSLSLEKYGETVRTELQGAMPENDDSIQEFTLESLAQNSRDKDGYYWRLEDLNRSVGPVAKGDFIIVAKRPEVGGTSFLVSEMSYMLEQLPDNANIILFNNEEEPSKVWSRMVSAAVNVDYKALMYDYAKYQQDYLDFLGTKTWNLCHNTSMTIPFIRNKLEAKPYDLIGINVLLKVGGTDAKEDHDKFQALGEECRRLAQQYGPVIAVVQADPSAENMRYIPQDRIYKSKTALQGEADALIMIGHDEDASPESRFLHVAKNKIPPAPCTSLPEKHIKSEVRFDIGTGRFTSINYPDHSRDKT